MFTPEKNEKKINNFDEAKNAVIAALEALEKIGYSQHSIATDIIPEIKALSSSADDLPESLKFFNEKMTYAADRLRLVRRASSDKSLSKKEETATKYISAINKLKFFLDKPKRCRRL